MSGWRLSLWALALTCFCGRPQSACADAPQALWQAAETVSGPSLPASAAPDAPLQSAATRSRALTLSPLLQTQDGIRVDDRLILPLFDGQVATVRVDRVTRNVDGVRTVRGRVQDAPYGYLLISSHGDRSLGDLKLPARRQRYAIVPAVEPAAHRLLDLSGSPPPALESGPPLRIPFAAAAAAADAPATLPTREHAAESATVDVMLLYTANAKNWADSNEGGIANVIAQAMAKAQLAHDNSGTLVTMRLVHSAQVAYTESGSSNTDLTRLRETSDGHMDEIHDWRDQYGADLVALLTQVEDTGGLGYLLTYTNGVPTYGFSITRVQQASWTYTLVHELGHNMGAHHHKAQTVQPGPTAWHNWSGNTWSAGWRWTGSDSGRYCSVMTYESGQYFADSNDHTRVAYFANPSVDYLGAATGHAADGDNARTLREMRHTMAAYRPTAPDPEGKLALYYADGWRGTDYMRTALTHSGYTVVDAVTWSDFNSKLAAGDYALAVGLNQDNSVPFEDGMGAISNYLQQGGSVVFADWQGHTSLANLFQASYTGVEDMLSIDLFDDTLADGVGNPLALADPGWANLFSFGMTALGGARAPGRFGNGDAALVQGHDGRSVLLGFMVDTVNATDGVQFFENLLQMMDEARDALDVEPYSFWDAAGYAGGPFDPPQKIYSLTNSSDAALDWTAVVTSNWVSLSATNGTLAAGATTDVTVGLTAQADALAAGIYRDTLVVSNVVSGATHSRNLTLTITALPGNIAIEDSIAPDDDRALPFGLVYTGQERVEQITIRNTNATHDLVVETIAYSFAAGTPAANDPHAAGETLAGAAELEAASGAARAMSSDPAPIPPRTRRSGAGRRAETSGADEPASRPGSILVGFRPGAVKTLQARSAVHAALGARRRRSFKLIAADVVEAPARRRTSDLIAAYRAHPHVAYAEPNYIVRAQEMIPDDPQFGQLWGLRNTGQSGGTVGADIAAAAAWQRTTGSSNVIVAVIDSGIDYNHPDLAGNMWVNPDPTFGDLHGATWTNGNGTASSGDPMDDYGHGTHVAGTVGALGSNGVGVVGVNWQVRLMALKFLKSDGRGSVADAIKALEYAVAHGARISNNSWGGGGSSQALKDAIAAAAHAGHLFVAAAGNDGTDNDLSPFYPAAYDGSNIVSVASSDRNDLRSGFSNYGATSVHLAAPGSEICSTTRGGGYGWSSGTSMASPHVAGVAALLLAQRPGASYADLKRWLTDSVTPLPQWVGVVSSGGRLNAERALRQPLADAFTLESLPALPATLGPGDSLTFSVRFAPLEAGDYTGTVQVQSNDRDEPVAEVALSGTATVPTVTLTVQTEGDGGVQPAGVMEVPVGSSTNVLFVADDWMRIESLTSNTVAVASAAGMKTFDMVLSDIQDAVTLVAVFAQPATMSEFADLPTAWLESWTYTEAQVEGLDSNALVRAYLFDTDPLAYESHVFELESVQSGPQADEMTVQARLTVNGVAASRTVNGVLELQATDEMGAGFATVAAQSFTNAVFDEQGRRAFVFPEPAPRRFYRARIERQP